MSREKLSDELLSRFLEGRTNEEEEAMILKEMEADSALFDEWLSMKKAAELADAEPLVKPDLALAEERIHNALHEHSEQKTQHAPRFFPFRPKLYWAAAASVALAVTLAFLLMRQPGASGEYVAKNEGTTVTETQPGEKLAQVQEGEVRQNPSSATQETAESHPTDAGAASGNAAWQETEHVARTEEVQRAATQEAKALRMVKPSKSSYAVLCKNLDKSFTFEWSASQVGTLFFSVTDAKGQTIASMTDKTAEKYVLKYRDIYPERQLKWELSVVSQDGTKETKSGQIQIDYQLQ